jgi:hypothetical protein
MHMFRWAIAFPLFSWVGLASAQVDCSTFQPCQYPFGDEVFPALGIIVPVEEVVPFGVETTWI